MEGWSVKLASGDAVIDIRLEGNAAVIDGRRVEFRQQRAAGELTGLVIDGRLWPVRTSRSGQTVMVWAAGRVFRIGASAGPSARMGEHADDLISPMPGRVVRVLASEGERVERGQPLLVLEAMKMEHVMRSGRDGVVRRIACAEGQQVEAGAVLVELGE
jgi:biotin carboxyl carrier protein